MSSHCSPGTSSCPRWLLICANTDILLLSLSFTASQSLMVLLMYSSELGEKIRVETITEQIYCLTSFINLDVVLDENYFRKYVGRSNWTFFIRSHWSVFASSSATGAADGAKIVVRVAASVFGRLINSQFSHCNQFAGVRSDLGYAWDLVTLRILHPRSEIAANWSEEAADKSLIRLHIYFCLKLWDNLQDCIPAPDEIYICC